MEFAESHIKKNRFLLGIVLNSAFIIIELFYGFKANSVALLADAVHNASDVLGLGMVWFSYFISQRQATHKFTYGFKNATIFATFINAVVLFLAIGNLVWESIMRMFAPQPVLSLIIIWVAVFGVIIKGFTALLFMQDRKSDLNILSLFLNMALDTVLGIAVVIGGFFIWWQRWYFIDPVLGLIIGLTIFYSFWSLFKESLNLIFFAVPDNIDLLEVIKDIKSFPEIEAYHDLHVWALSTTETALSVHVITTRANFNPAVTYKLAELFRDKYKINHSTIQLEVTGGDHLPMHGC